MMTMRSLLWLHALGFALASPLSSSHAGDCRCLPGDSCWPSNGDWTIFNKTLNGALLATVPLAKVCHAPSYNAAACETLRSNWGLAQTFQSSPSEVMLPLFQNTQCDPFTNSSTPCRQGNLVAYSVNVTNAEHVQSAVKFAAKRNLRLVIKNTGHDFLGKSSGQGALGIWTHNLKTIKFFDYKSSYYTGPAVRLGAGIQAYDAYAAAGKAGHKLVGGDCTTVGLVGGYSQGAGHGPLGSTHGLGADQVLEWEVVTADGEHLTVSPQSPHADLYWALAGGGPGTFAIVLSATYKVFPESQTGGASLTVNANPQDPEGFWDMVEKWQAYSPTLVDNGAQIATVLSNVSLDIKALTLVGHNGDKVQKLLDPMLQQIKAHNLTYKIDVRSSATYFDHIVHFYGPLPYGQYGVNDILGSRLIPRSVADKSNAQLTQALRNITDMGFGINILAQNVSHATAGNKPGSNAVLPAWRDSIYHMVPATTWDYYKPRASNVANQDLITSTIVPFLEKLTPGSGSYLNEADVNLASWKEDFYGSNWDKLNAIKQKYDPKGVFYAYKAVGSQQWTLSKDGKLCKAH